MAIELNHTIVAAGDGEASARWFTDLFGLPEPTRVGHFWQVSTANGVDLDFDTFGDDAKGDDEPVASQHYAFLVDEEDFEAIFTKIRERDLDHWADPGRQRPAEINHRGGGRGVYFLSNDGHLLEILTRPDGG